RIAVRVRGGRGPPTGDAPHRRVDAPRLARTGDDERPARERTGRGIGQRETIRPAYVRGRTGEESAAEPALRAERDDVRTQHRHAPPAQHPELTCMKRRMRAGSGKSQPLERLPAARCADAE